LLALREKSKPLYYKKSSKSTEKECEQENLFLTAARTTLAFGYSYQPQEEAAMKDYDEIIREKGLPNVGETVRSKKYKTLWRVLEKREVWQNIDPDPKTGEPRMIPAIYLAYWKIQEGIPPGVGKMMGYLYTLYDNTFALNWEKVD
jgi:hypothetical protein